MDVARSMGSPVTVKTFIPVKLKGHLHPPLTPRVLCSVASCSQYPDYTALIMATLIEASTSSSSRPLPRLPVELIEQIFSSSNDVKTLATICSVSKLGRRAATPILYKTLGVTSESIDTDNGDSIERAARSLRLQCRTLLENRELAKHVREIRQYISSHIFAQLHDMKVFKPKQCRKVLNHDIKLPSNVVEAVMCSLTAEHIGGQTDEACFMLLLALCPQATILRLEGELGVVRAMAHLNGIIQEVSSSRREAPSLSQCLAELKPAKATSSKSDLLRHIGNLPEIFAYLLPTTFAGLQYSTQSPVTSSSSSFWLLYHSRDPFGKAWAR